VEYLRFAGAGLPPGQAIALMSSRQLLVVGVLVLLMTVPLWLVVSGFAWVWRKMQEKHPPRQEKGGHIPPAGEVAAFGASLGFIAVFAFQIVAFFADNKADATITSLANSLALATALGSVLGALAAFLGATAWRPFFRWSDLLRLPRQWLVGILLAVAVAAGASFAYFTPLKIPRASVQLRDGTCLTGLYLSRDSEGIHLIDGPSGSLFTVFQKDLVGIQVGEPVGMSDWALKSVGCPKGFRQLTISSTPARSSQGSERPAGRGRARRG